MRIPSIDRQLGLETYLSATPGIGGKIRQQAEDFLVQELLVDGSRAELEPTPRDSLNIPEKGRYLICLLVKRNYDTLLAARTIAKQLGISERRVQIAGIKDKRAATAQHISIEAVKLKQLQRIRSDSLRVIPLRYSPNMVFPHMLFGNAFHITVRGIRHSSQATQERVAGIAEEIALLGGVPNFFGHQRFGTRRPITHLVGRAFAENNLKKAATLFLATPSPHEHPESRVARQRLLETGDFKAALAQFPRRLLYERLMLRHLAQRPHEYVKAFRKLPARLLRLFLQAYQSLLFNRFLSQRLAQRIPINEPQVGDYVTRADRHGLPSKSSVMTTLGNIDTLREAVKKGRMHVALPLVGFKQAPSEGVEGELEQSSLAAEKVTQANFHVPSMPEAGAAGELRTAVAAVTGLHVEPPVRDELNPHKKQLRISFELHRGCYATVVLREFMKPWNLINSGY